jgi:hypothetical protein
MGERVVHLRGWLVSRKILLCVSMLALVLAGMAAAREGYLQHQRTKVEVALEAGGPCKFAEPLFVVISNHSSSTVRGVGFQLQARKRGQPANLVPDGLGNWDGVIPPGGTAGVCWSYPALGWEKDAKTASLARPEPRTANPDKSSLEWSVARGNVVFAN